jgi:predicted DNA-binding ribbon-helix-helix protein
LDAGHDVGNFTSFLRVCCLRFIDLQLRGLIPNVARVKLSQLPASDILLLETIERSKANPRLT